MKKKSKRLIDNTLLFLLGSLGSKFIQFILVPIYTHTLDTSEYGVTEIILTTVDFLLPIFSISIADGFLRFGLDKKNDKEDVTAICLKITFIGSLFSIICIPLYKINVTLTCYLFYFLLILNLRMYRDDLSIRLKILNKNKLYAIDSILYTFVLCISNIIMLVILKMKIEGYFLSYIIANIVSTIFLIISSKFSFSILLKKNNKELAKKILKYSFPMIANAIAWWITNASDKFMIQYLISNEAVGIYSIATKLPTMVSTFTGVFNQAWIISSVIEFDNDKEKEFYSKTFRRYISFLFLAVSSLIFIIKPFIRVYVNATYFEAWKYAPILIASATVSGIAAFLVGIYAASMKNLNVTITTIIGGVINIVLNLLLIKYIGIMGAAIATYISWFIIAAIRIMDIKKFFNFNMHIKVLLLYNMLTIIQCLCIVMLDNILGRVISGMILLSFIVLERRTITYIIKTIINKVKNFKEFYRTIIRTNIRKKYRNEINNKDITIISSNCIGGIIYHDMGVQFKSPTINMYIRSKDFIKLCTNLKAYMKETVAEEKNTEFNFPVLRINDILLYCVHYKSFKEAREKWNERKERINYDNIYIIMSERDRMY